MTSYAIIYRFCNLNDTGRPDPAPHIHIHCRDSQHSKTLEVSREYFNRKWKQLVHRAMECGKLSMVSISCHGYASIGFLPRSEGDSVDLFGVNNE